MSHLEVREWAAETGVRAEADASEADGQLPLRVALAATLALVLAVAVVGNVLLLLVLLKFGRLRRVHNLSYMSLCCSDLLAVALCLPASGTLLVYTRRQDDAPAPLGLWWLDAALCAPWLGALLAVSLASVLSICSIALGMYLRIQNPYQYRKLLSRVTGIGLLVLIWLLALLGAALPPHLLAKRVYTVIAVQSPTPAPGDTPAHEASNNSTTATWTAASAAEPHAEGLCFYQLSHAHAALLVGLGFCVPCVLLVLLNGLIFRFSRQQYAQICRSYYSQLNLVITHSVSMPHSLNHLAALGNQLVSRYSRMPTSYSQQPASSAPRPSPAYGYVNRAESLQQRDPPLFLNIRRRSQEQQGAMRLSAGRGSSSAVSPATPHNSQVANAAHSPASAVGTTATTATTPGAGSGPLKRGSTTTNSSSVSNAVATGAQSAAHRSSMADMPGRPRGSGLKAARTLGTITLSFLYASARPPRPGPCLPA